MERQGPQAPPGTCGRWRCSLPGCCCAWWGCVTARPGWPAGRRRPSGRARWPAGAAWRWGRTWCATPCSGTRPGPPCPGPTLPGRRRPWGTVCLPGPGPVQEPGRGGHRPVHPPGLQPHLPGPGRGPGHPGQLQRRGGDRLPRPEPRRPSPAWPAGRGPPAGLPPARHPAPRNRSSSAAWGRSTRRAAPTTCWASSSPWPGSPTRCSAPSSSTGCCGWRAPLLPQKTPSRCAPMDFVGPGCPGGPGPGGGLHPGGGRLLWEARPLPAGWQASA